MGRLIPIFREADHEYRIDTCRPQIEAVESGQADLVALSHGLYPGEPMAAHHLPGLSSIGYLDAVGPQNWGMNPHRNEGIEIHFLERGTSNVRIDSQEIWMKPNDLTVTRPWQEHGSGKEGFQPGRLHWFILDVGVRRPNQEWVWPKWIVLSKEDQDALSKVLRENERPLWPADKAMARCFAKIGDAVAGDRSGSSMSWLALLINEVLLRIRNLLGEEVAQSDPGHSPSRRTVEVFLDDLRRHPEHLKHPWSLEEMARECGMSKRTLSEYTRHLTNESPVGFVTGLRLKLAAEMLKAEPALSVTDLAQRLGFGSSQYFSRLFRERLGSTPSKWRKMQHEGS